MSLPKLFIHVTVVVVVSRRRAIKLQHSQRKTETETAELLQISLQGEKQQGKT